MSVGRRRAKAARNARDIEARKQARTLTDLVSAQSDWITSGRISCSYGVHLAEPLPEGHAVAPLHVQEGHEWRWCSRCGAVYSYRTASLRAVGA